MNLSNVNFMAVSETKYWTMQHISSSSGQASASL